MKVLTLKRLTDTLPALQNLRCSHPPDSPRTSLRGSESFSPDGSLVALSPSSDQDEGLGDQSLGFPD